MGITQFDKVVKVQSNPGLSVSFLNGSASTSLASGTFEYHLFYAPTGTVAELENLVMIFAAITEGGASGSKQISVALQSQDGTQQISTNVMVGAFGARLEYVENAPLNTSSYTPNDLAALEASTHVLYSAQIPLVLSFQQSSTVATIATRSWWLFSKVTQIN